MGGDKRKYEEVVEEVHESQGPGVPRTKISQSHSNTSLTLKKVHLVVALLPTSKMLVQLLES